MAILDHRGEPVRVGALKQEHGAGSITNVRTIWQPPVATGLTPSTLAEILRAAAEGDHVSYLTLAEEMEERESHYSSVLRTRKLAVSGLIPIVEAVTDDAEDVKIADACRDLLEDERSVDLYEDCLDAIAKGYSCVEMIWDTEGKEWRPDRYEWRDPRFFVFDQDTLNEIRLLDAEDTNEGLRLAAFKWIVHKPRIKTGITVRGGLARLIAAHYMCKGYTIKDWLAFAEVFGMPIRVGKYNPMATEDDIDTLASAVANIGTDAGAVLPETMQIDYQVTSQGAGGAPLYGGLADYFDKQTSKAVLGQTMTADDGSSLAQAKIHNEVRDDIQLSDARQLAKTIRRDLLGPFVALNFGEDKAIPKFRLSVEESEDLEALSKALPPFIDRGLKVEASVIRDRFGIEEPADDAELLEPKSSGGGFGGGDGPDDDKADDKADDRPEPDKTSTARATDAQNELVIELARRMRAGEKLSEGELRILEIALAATTETEIERLANIEAGDWRRIMGPVLDPIIALAESAKNVDDFRAKLSALELDTTEVLSSMSIALFKSRGLGDSTDQVT